ncbi:MAG: MaoC/PaaZ C-terminal domain-containing protein [Nannocystaceae bacterium]
MPLPTRHIFHQGPVIASLGGTALAALRQHFGQGPSAPISTPSPEIRATLPPRPKQLIRDYVRHVGGDPSAYRKTVPAHLFPQWGFALAAQTLVGIPYPMARVLNGGCRLEIRSPIPQGEPLEVVAQLRDIDDNGRRAVLHQTVVTGTASAPDALTAHLYAIVPLSSKGKSSGTAKPKRAKKPPVLVPAGATELAFWKLSADAGLAFAMLTGDFNPVHWVRPYARMFGFRSTILHGFSTMARAIEGLSRGAFAGSTRKLSSIDVKFTRPLVLPAKVGLYIHESDAGKQVFVGDCAGGPAYLVGTYTLDG